MERLFSGDNYPGIRHLVNLVDQHLKSRFPDYYGDDAMHPHMQVKSSKVIHDNLWGTNSFSWQELSIIDSPILQRLRGIHQTGLAYNVYPCAHHTRFEHSLGVATVASKIFDSLLRRQRGKFRDIVRSSTPNTEDDESLQKAIAKLRLELRLAGILHDTGHSLLSHSSEQVFENLACVRDASDELAQIVGKRKGAGEALAFAVAISDSIRGLLTRVQEKVKDHGNHDDFSGLPDMLNVALMIVGRTIHPFLQFLADIITSGFDADKLDYLLRDATSAGLPLSYDFERYFYAVRMEDNILADGQQLLQTLYEQVCSEPLERKASSQSVNYAHYETHRLRLPIRAMNTIEQIVICKLMLFSYIYHHPKVRAGEGMFVDLMRFVVDRWRESGSSDDDILHRFLDMTDASLSNPGEIAEGLTEDDRSYVESTLLRIRNRLLPREVFRIGGAIATGSERAMLADFLTSLQDRQKRPGLLRELTLQISANALDARNDLGSNADAATRTLGLRVDVPKAPKFEDVDDLVVKGTPGEVDLQLLQVFPIGQWTHAYTHYRYYVRIFCYSEYVDTVERAAVQAMKSIINIESDDFYKKISRYR